MSDFHVENVWIARWNEGVISDVDMLDLTGKTCEKGDKTKKGPEDFILQKNWMDRMKVYFWVNISGLRAFPSKIPIFL